MSRDRGSVPEIFRKRQAALRRGIDFSRARCLEIGALTTPVLTRDACHVLYADRVDTEGLLRQFAWDPGVTRDNLAPVDVVWLDRPLKECVDGLFDLVVASHVGEHVPDLIGWLAEASEVLSAEGEIRLMLPDARFSFDALRPPTRLADLLVAWMQKRRTPDARDILDFALHKVRDSEVRCQDFYEGVSAPGDMTAQFSFEEALDWVRPALSDPSHYVDVHCWVFTPRHLAELMIPLARNNVLDLACAGFEDTAPPGFEFGVFFRVEPDVRRRVESWERMAREAADPLPGSAAARERVAEPAEESRVLQDESPLDGSHWRERLRGLPGMTRLRQSAAWRYTAPVRRRLR
nr:methyltransferase domain-containing protein [Gluconobacter oxydans]